MIFLGHEIRFQRRTDQLSGLKAVYVRMIFLLLGLVFLGGFFYLIGIDTLKLYSDIIEVNILLFPTTLASFIPLLCIAVGLAVPFRARIDNIGAEGQYIMGTLAGIGTASLFAFLPSMILIPLMFAVGFIIGALWALPVVIFRAKGGFQGADVVVSFLMVFPALYTMLYLISGPWRDPETGFTYSSKITAAGEIPRLDFTIDLPFYISGNKISWDFSTVHVTIFFVLFLAVLIYYVLFRKINGIPATKLGYEISVTGKNRLAGQNVGMSFFRVILYSMILSGGLAGVAGVAEIAGNQLRLTPDTPGYGFTAIAVAYLGALHPLGIIFSALFFAVLLVGGTAIKLTQGLPGTALDLFSGAILFFVLVAEFFFRYKLSIRNKNV